MNEELFFESLGFGKTNAFRMIGVSISWAKHLVNYCTINDEFRAALKKFIEAGEDLKRFL